MTKFKETIRKGVDAVSSTLPVVTETTAAYYEAQGDKINMLARMHAAKFNAVIARNSADMALLRGDQQIAQYTANVSQNKAKLRVANAAAGVDIGYGNAYEIQQAIDLATAVDVQVLKSNAIAEAWGYQVGAANANSEAIFRAADASSISPLSRGLTTLFGTTKESAKERKKEFETIYDKWKKVFKKGKE